MKAYKVLREIDGRLCSCVMGGKAKTVYRERVNNHAPEWLEREGYYPLCFSRLRFANDFMCGHLYGSCLSANLVIFQVEGEKATLKPMLTAGIGRGVIERLIGSGFEEIPGVIMLKTVKLIRRVK